MNKFKNWLENKHPDEFNNNYDKFNNKDLLKSNYDKIDNKGSLENFDKNKSPKNGDRAYSIYHGRTYVGMFSLHGKMGERITGHLVFPPLSWVKNPTNKTSLSVGYDEPIVWDREKGMFYAPADSD
jgi:hypothetical protein